MAEQNVFHIERCDSLRWKELFISDSASAQPSADSTLWCLKTQTCLGPDGQPVEKYECNPARSCYKAL